LDRLGGSGDGDDTALLAEGEDMGYCEYGKGREEGGDYQ
jgi:hypothetical protein